MTLDELIHSDKLILTPEDAAPLLGCDPQKIRTQAKQCPELLGFNVSVVGSRVKIPKLPFIQFLTELRPMEEQRRRNHGK